MGGLLSIIIGILLMVFGIFMAFLFPGTKEQQGDSFQVIGIVMNTSFPKQNSAKLMGLHI